MKQYIETESGSFVIDGMSIPKAEGNRHYRQMMNEIANGGTEDDEGNLIPEAEIIPFDHAAYDEEQAIAAEVAWAKSQLDNVRQKIEQHMDNYTGKKSTEIKWRKYRNAIRNYIQSPDPTGASRPTAPS